MPDLLVALVAAVIVIFLLLVPFMRDHSAAKKHLTPRNDPEQTEDPT